MAADSLYVESKLYTHLHDTSVNVLNARVGSNALLTQAWQDVNQNANYRGADFLTEALGQMRADFARRNGVLLQVDPAQGNQPLNAADPQGGLDIVSPSNNPLRARFEEIQKLHRFHDNYAGQYALYLKNSKTLEVGEVTAHGPGSPNVYIEAVGADSDLKISGTVSTRSDNEKEGGIILIAGRQLDLEGRLETISTRRYQLVDIIGKGTTDNQDQFGPRRSVLNAAIFNGGQGIAPQNDFTSSQFVIRLNNQSSLNEDYRTHTYQRVVTHLGFANESGFMSYVGYADGNVQQFDVAGEAGIRDGSRDQLDLSNQSAIQAALSPNNAVVFTRSIAFNNAFLDSNQTLPTVAIVRRADDFYLFENASAADRADITDLTVEYQEVKEVRTLGAQGATSYLLIHCLQQFRIR